MSSGSLTVKYSRSVKQTQLVTVNTLYLEVNFSFQLFLSPGIVNQGETVGNTKGLVVIVIQYGEVLRCGMVISSVGTVAPSTATSLSGKALSGNFGAAQAKISFVKSFVGERKGKMSGAKQVFNVYNDPVISMF